LQVNRFVGGKMDTRASRLRRLIESPELGFVMEAHNGLSARIVEEAGFDAIWAGGLALSASQGLRDCNEASWTQTLECIELMADAASLPILVDGDTGHGNFNNARRFVRKLEQRGVSGVCLEDKVFPKTNSFIHGEGQTLADCDEFCGKLKAAKDAVRDDQFVVVARTEALIVGRGLTEALRRAHAYARAGADAILIHSARRDASEVLEFKREWGTTLPVLAVPTKYYDTPTETFRAHGFSALIWANHLLRSCIRAMQDTASRLFADQCLRDVEGAIAPLAEVFRLQRIDELRDAEHRYLLPATPTGLQRIA
jgi:phosphoenolpyruvate phosphomutase